MTLTAKSIQEATPGAILRDDTVRGLELRVYPNGRRVFYLYFRTKTGIPRRPRIEDFGAITLDQARKIARDMLADVARGMDPVYERQLDRNAARVSDLCDKYLQYVECDKKGRKKPKSVMEDRRMIERYIRPKFGARAVKDIVGGDIEKLHRALANTPYQANRVLALLSRMFNLAAKWAMRVDDNPCKHVLRFDETARTRYLQPDEAARVAAALNARESNQPEAVAFVYLLILSGARPEELSRARWEWLERAGDAGVLRLPDSKTGARPVYLPAQVMRVIDRLPRRAETILRIKSPTRLWNSVRVEANVPDVRLYDLRHTFASAALEAGFTLDQIGELLGHRSTQTTKRYAHLMEGKAHEAAAGAAAILEQRMKGVSPSLVSSVGSASAPPLPLAESPPPASPTPGPS